MSLRRATVPILLLLSLLLAAGCGGGGDPAQEQTLTIVVNAPFSKSPYVGETIARGVELGATAANPFDTTEATYRIRVKRLDNALSPRKAIANVREAVADGAVAIVDEGTGVDASWRIAEQAKIPIGITYQGGVGLVDPASRPNVFRIAPTDRGIAFRLAEYVIPKGLKVAILTDDSGYGDEGRAALQRSFGSSPEAIASWIRLPADATDASPQVLQARRAGATALLVWARPATIANVLTAARSRRWQVPVYTPPSGADPLVRQQLADRPEWVDGLTFASGRMTAELGPQAWQSFESQFESRYGPDPVGVKTSAGAEVVQPPEYAMYAYDCVNVLSAALKQAGGASDPQKVLDALNQVTVRGSNGDERGFNLHNHDGVVDDDVYFARFRDMTFEPVKDDPLSSTLPTIDQVK
ncbi:MAG TPA: ABC transporter substrate-binding protein [Gaiellaceae bacterium]|nr:ABC transporter substrate-binding protein [Gaiellaceae bacterium]